MARLTLTMNGVKVSGLKPGRSLEEAYPEIARQWHPEKNGFLKPYQVGCMSAFKAWWLGDCGHEWLATVNSRTKGAGCPYCSGRTPIKGVNDFETLAPEIATQWHPAKNGDLKACDVTLHSGRNVWWLDEYGHEWKATPASRADGTGCPVCANRLKMSFPEVAVFFYVSKAFPDAVQHYSPCSDDFGNMSIDIWIPSIRTAIEYDGCAWHTDAVRDRRKDDACQSNGMRIVRIRERGCVEYDTDNAYIILREDVYTNESLSKAIRELMLFLDVEHSDVDADRDENEITELIGVTGYSRTISHLFPDVAASWHPTMNGGLTPFMYTPGSSKKIWWLCGECGNEWITSISVRCIDGCGCPKCGRKKLREYKAPKIGQSLAEKYPDVAKMWHPVKNDGLTPFDVTSKSERVVWWICPECDREWQQSIAYRTDSKSCVCGKCAHMASITTPKEGCSLKDRYPEIANEWDYDRNDGLTPSDVKPQSSYMAWWICSKCGNKWQKSVTRRTRHGNAHCPTCNRSVMRKPIVGKNDLLSKRPEIARDWAPDLNDGLTAQDISYMSNSSFWWRCHTCGTEWQTTAARRSSHTAMCPTCTRLKEAERLQKPTQGNSLTERNPEFLKMWDTSMNGGIDPSTVSYKSNRGFWWKCERGHGWKLSPNGMSQRKEWCPYCGDRKLLVGYNDLETRFPDVAADWDFEKNEESPSEVRYNISSKRWWKCHECGREWEAPVCVRTIGGNGCRSCSQRARHQRNRDAKAVEIKSRDDAA